MKEEVTIKRLIIGPLKRWNNSNIGNNLNESKFCSAD